MGSNLRFTGSNPHVRTLKAEVTRLEARVISQTGLFMNFWFFRCLLPCKWSHLQKEFSGGVFFKKSVFKVTLMQTWKFQYMLSSKYLSSFENNMLKISHWNSFYFLRYAHVSYVKSLFTNIPKQQNMLKTSLLFKKLVNFTGK